MSEENKVVEVDENEIIDVAKEANQLIFEKDKELKELKLKLARSELYRTVEEEEVEEPYDLNKDFTPNSSDLDIAIHAVQLHKYELDNIDTLPIDDITGKPKFTLGARAQDIHDYLEYCISGSEGDPKKFHKIYHLNLAEDSYDVKKIYQENQNQIQINNIRHNIK